MPIGKLNRCDALRHHMSGERDKHQLINNTQHRMKPIVVNVILAKTLLNMPIGKLNRCDALRHYKTL
jgi:hypothetical protein